MDRRDFLLRAGLMSAALTSATTAPAGFEQQRPGRRVGRHGQITLANDALLWQLEWRERRLRSSRFENRLSGHAFPLSEASEIMLTLSA